MGSVKNIAIVGAGGNIGGTIANALLKAGIFHVTAITRPDSSSVIPPGLNIVKTSYEHASLVNALKGQDALIITMNVMAPPDSQNKLIDAAVEAGVKYVMPSEWGADVGNMEQVSKDMFVYDSLMSVRNHLEKTGAQWIAIACSFWYEFSLAGTEIRYGFDLDRKTVTLFGDGDVKINTSTWPQVGRAVAAVFAEPEKFKNRSVHINSFYVSQKDMLESVERVTGEKFTITTEPVQERYMRGVQMLQQGNMAGFGIGMYTRGFFPDGALSFEVENEALGLPKEDFDEATRVAVEMAKRGETNALG